MMIREPAVAGRFYPRDPHQCLAMLESCVTTAEEESARSSPAAPGSRRSRIIAAVLPHAGWTCSGAIAARAILAISKDRCPQTVVIFGAVHVPHGQRASIFPSGAWETPLGLALIDHRLAERICGQTGLLESDPHAHEEEHSIEVEIPFVQRLLPEAKIIPIMVPPNEHAAALGTAIGNACRNYKADVVFLASTDLTHYGPAYGFTPHGVGQGGLAWARDVNDRRMIELISGLRADQAVPEAIANRNACGPGAIAATLAAAKSYGATRAGLLEHTNSDDVLRRIGSEPSSDAVGYAAILLD